MIKIDKLEEIMMGEYKNDNPSLDNIEDLCRIGKFVFFTWTFQKEFHNDIFEYIKRNIQQFENKLIVFIDDIDKKWLKWNRFIKSIVLLVMQQEGISLREFSVEAKKSTAYICYWGIAPLPSKNEIWKDVQRQLRKLIERLEENED